MHNRTQPPTPIIRDVTRAPLTSEQRVKARVLQTALALALLLVVALLMRLQQLHLAASHLQDVLGRKYDIYIHAESQWNRTEAAQTSLVTVGLALVICGALLLLARRN